MVDPNCAACPRCGVQWYALQRVERIRRLDQGTVKQIGWFYSCACGAFTRQSTGEKRFNLKNSVAKHYNIARLTASRKKTKQLDLSLFF